MANKPDDNKGSKNWFREIWNGITANKAADDPSYNDRENLHEYINNRFKIEHDYFKKRADNLRVCSMFSKF